MPMAHPRERRAAIVALILAITASAVLSGCKVVSVEEDRALRSRRGASFDAASYVDGIWAAKVLPTLNRSAVPLTQLMPAIASDLSRAGRGLGRHAGEGSPWTFVVTGEGRVESVDTASPRGSVQILLSGVAPARSIRLQTGPVVSGTAIRDALPFVAFNDFTDQLSFADVGRALTARSFKALGGTARGLKPGQAIRFTGVASVDDANAPIVITPVAIAAVGASAAAT